MTTTGSTLFNMDFTEIAEEAWERAGREMRSGYDLRTARRSMNLMTIEWQNKGINMWTMEQGFINLTAGLATYALPTDTIDLLEHVIRTGQNTASTQADLTISRISVSTYATIPNKLQQARPIQVWVQRLSGQVNPTSSITVGAITSTDTTITLDTVVGLAGSGHFLAALMLSTKFGYGRPAALAIALALDFLAEDNFLGLPRLSGLGLSQTSPPLANRWVN